MTEVTGARAAVHPACGLSDGLALEDSGGRPVDNGMFHYSGPFLNLV